MIVKDEEKQLSNCLESIKDLVEEIIIVDTGSIDKTKEISNKYKANIYDFKWTESFSEARNFGINKASKEWILWLDADEEITIENIEEVKNSLQSNKENLYLIPIINYYGSSSPDPNLSYLFASNRLFRNHKGFKFTGNIHEQLTKENLDEKGLGKIEIINCIKIHHYGYMDSVIEDKKKNERNLKLLQNEKKDSNYNPWIDYHIASEYYRMKEYEKAFTEVNSSILRFLQNQQFPPSLLYKLKYEILILLKSYKGAKAGIDKAIALYPKYVDLHFYKGIILFQENLFEEALTVFKHCLELGESEIQYLILSGTGSYAAWYFIGCCYENLGDYSKASNSYIQSLNIYPNYTQAQLKLLELPKY